MNSYVPPMQGALPAASRSEPVLRLGQLVRLMRRYLWLIVICALVAMGGAFVYARTLPKTFTASSLMSVEGARFAIPELQGALAPDSSPDPFPLIRTEVQALTARAQLEGVIATMRLDADPEFNPALRPKSPVQKIKDFIGNLTSPMLPSGPKSAAAPANDDAVVGSVMQALTVFQDNRSLVISVAFTSRDPVLAANVVNALITSYVQARARHVADANKGANAVMEQRIDQVRNDLQDIEKKMNDLRSSGTMVTLPAGSVGQQQVQELTTAAAKATLDRSQLEETYNRALAAVKQGNSDQLAAVLNSPTISQLRDQEAAATSRMAQLSTYYGAQYPGIRSAQAQVSTARRQIADEAARIVASLGDQLRAARGQEQSVLAQLQTARHTSVAGENARAQLDQLQQEATTRRALYQTLLEREQQTAAQPVTDSTPDVRVLTRRRRPPASPSGPNTRLAALMGGAGGALFGCLLALTQMRSVRGHGQLGRRHLGHGHARRRDHLPQAGAQRAGAAGCERTTIHRTRHGRDAGVARTPALHRAHRRAALPGVRPLRSRGSAVCGADRRRLCAGRRGRWRACAAGGRQSAGACPLPPGGCATWHWWRPWGGSGGQRHVRHRLA